MSLNIYIILHFSAFAKYVRKKAIEIFCGVLMKAAVFRNGINMSIWMQPPIAFPLRGRCRGTRRMRCSLPQKALFLSFNGCFASYTSSTALAVPLPLKGKAYDSFPHTEPQKMKTAAKKHLLYPQTKHNRRCVYKNSRISIASFSSRLISRLAISLETSSAASY